MKRHVMLYFELCSTTVHAHISVRWLPKDRAAHRASRISPVPVAASVWDPGCFIAQWQEEPCVMPSSDTHLCPAPPQLQMRWRLLLSPCQMALRFLLLQPLDSHQRTCLYPALPREYNTTCSTLSSFHIICPRENTEWHPQFTACSLS